MRECGKCKHGYCVATVNLGQAFLAMEKAEKQDSACPRCHPVARKARALPVTTAAPRKARAL